MSDFLMPSLGADMESGRVVEWLVQPGDRVKSGQVIVIIETEKGAIDVEIFEDGVIDALVAELDVELPVGALLARVAGTASSESAAAAQAVERSVPTPAPPLRTAAVSTLDSGAGVIPRPAAVGVRASPRARHLAAARGLDLATIAGTGPDGAVLGYDIERTVVAASADPSTPRTRGFDATAMRHAIGIAMSRSKRDIPHYYLSEQVTLKPALTWLAAHNATVPVSARVLPAVLLLKASALALTRHPAFNGHFIDDNFRPAQAVHVGWAIALRGGGLIAPAMRDVAERGLGDLMQALRDLVQRARGGGLRGSELTSATVTVTSQGERGAEAVWPIIHPPQVAMLGFGRIVDRPWVTDDGISPQPVVTVSVAADHRVSDGHAGGLFLDEIARLLADPAALDSARSDCKTKEAPT